MTSPNVVLCCGSYRYRPYIDTCIYPKAVRFLSRDMATCVLSISRESLLFSLPVHCVLLYESVTILCLVVTRTCVHVCILIQDYLVWMRNAGFQ